MTWTYSGDPSSSAKDEVRFLVGDTESTEPKVSDEEIAFLLDAWDEDSYDAAMAVAEHLANTAASWIDYSADGVTLTLSEVQEKYRLLAADLSSQKSRRVVLEPYAGGISVADVEAHENDLSVVHTDFGTGMHDNRREGAYGGSAKKDLLGGPW